MVELRVQELARKCHNRSRLLDPHGRCAGAAPGSHRQDTVGAGRTQWRPRRRTGRSTIRLVWLCTQGISPGMPEFSIEHPGRGRQMPEDGATESARWEKPLEASPGKATQSHHKAIY
jgi:hypothetical protein